MAVVETRKLTKVFAGGAGAVTDVDLVTADGEFLVFLGPSGSGKSTLLRMIAGLEEPTRGEVLIGGAVVTGLAPRARGVAMVFQSYALYPHMTVEKNIAFPLKAQGVARASRAGRVRRAAALVGIEHLLARRPRELSGGERQRVALARALVREPSVFLLDEPLSNLDAKLRSAAREELTRFHERVGTTTLYVTHDQVEAMAMGDRIVVLERGTVRQIGTPREVYDAPADVFVATFLGSPPMNLVEDAQGVVGFRPENVLPAASAPPDALPLRLRVTLAEYLGAERVLHAVVEGGRFDGRKVLSRLPVSAAQVGAGAVHPFAVARGAVHRFDARTGRRIPGGDVGWR